MNNDSLKLFESVKFDNGKLVFDNHSSRFIGVVNGVVYDKSGNVIMRRTDTNELILPGSIFVLEQMFKTKYANRMSYNIPTQAHNPGVAYPTVDLASGGWLNPQSVNDEKIFGFMCGFGGSEVDGVHSVTYDATTLHDKNNTASFMPFRITSEQQSTNVYPFSAIAGTSPSQKYFAYVKAFDSNPTIVKADDNKSCHAHMELTITAEEFAEYYALDTEQIAYNGFNQIGLVAGYLNGKVWTDIRLITTVNFPMYSLSAGETLHIDYEIYSLQ